MLLATDKKILLAPAMNPQMWSNNATRRNLAQLVADGVTLVGPNAGEMAESGEAGIGRMAEPLEIVAAVQALLAANSGALAGVRMLVTSGPTHEPIDPVRYIANRSSGKQGHAIAEAAASAGAEVTLVSGPVNVPDPRGVKVVKVESARDMLAAVEASLPADVAVFAAAVADWRTASNSREKIKKTGKQAPELALVENPDILSTVAHLKSRRPKLVIGFAAETEHVIEHAKAKLARKGCDWILANDVSPETGIMGGDSNTIHLVTADNVENWPPQSKSEVAALLVARIAAALERDEMKSPSNQIHAAAARRRSAAAGLSERRRRRPRSDGGGADRRARNDRARRPRADPDRDRRRTAARHRRPGASALGPRGASRHHRVEHSRHDRLRLSGGNTRNSCEFGQRIICG